MGPQSCSLPDRTGVWGTEVKPLTTTKCEVLDVCKVSVPMFLAEMAHLLSNFQRTLSQYQF